jgi:hypothetical protein
MMIQARFAEGIARGDVTMTFRRWKRCQVVAGHRYRTAAGRIVVDSVAAVDPASITAAEARRCGFATRDALLAELRGDESLPTYCIQFHPYDGPDERAELAATDALEDDDRTALDRRLARMGPWTLDVLRAIERHPGLRAPDLAAQFGRETLPFKRDVRKLKELGLTISLRVGYELSPRGAAYLATVRRGDGRGSTQRPGRASR